MTINKGEYNLNISILETGEKLSVGFIWEQENMLHSKIITALEAHLKALKEAYEYGFSQGVA